MELLNTLFTLLGTVFLIGVCLYAVYHLPVGTTTPSQDNEGFWETDNPNPDIDMDYDGHNLFSEL